MKFHPWHCKTYCCYGPWTWRSSSGQRDWIFREEMSRNPSGAIARARRPAGPDIPSTWITKSLFKQSFGSWKLEGIGKHGISPDFQLSRDGGGLWQWRSLIAVVLVMVEAVVSMYCCVVVGTSCLVAVQFLFESVRLGWCLGQLQPAPFQGIPDQIQLLTRFGQALLSLWLKNWTHQWRWISMSTSISSIYSKLLMLSELRTFTMKSDVLVSKKGLSRERNGKNLLNHIFVFNTSDVS